ncbi:unnamed protein product [Adineta steineri]|uniref:ubiquitinyl hydrolase 1 n=2 Tax=Adineta steineri TaxID=433720 RepID=A0A813WLD0_9BILA|nr:unnamed protein product [Adineta steineri]
MSSVNQESNILHDSYGSYTPSPPLPPVPPFPCAVDSLCTADNRICDQHKYVIFVKTHKTDGTFEIPYGQWESWVWYKQRISDRTGVPIQEIRIVYAGVERDGLNRHSGLQKQSTIHMIQREEEQVEEYIEPPREKIDVEALITENGDCPTLNLMMKNLNANEAKLLMELLKNNKTVTSLDLSLNWIGNEGVQSVADALNNNTVSKPAMDEMRRLEMIEKNYPIKIEHYLATERYIDWCLPNLCEDDQLSLKSSNTTTEPSSKRRHLKRVTCQTSNLDTAEATRKPEHLIICERQEQLFSGRHVLRALSQTLDLFDDDYLKEVAQNIAATEQINRHGEAIQLTEYYYENTGEYDIQVLKAALMNIFSIDLLQIGTLQPNSLILSHIQHVQAFLIQQNYHYYCLRRFRLTEDYFFKIDSKNPTYHEPIHRDNILNFLKSLLEHGSNIYVTVQYISDAIEDEITTDNIKTRLWALPDAPADREALVNM